MSGNHWSPAHLEYLSKHYETAPTIEEVAKAVGRTRAATNHKAWTMGLSRPDQGDEWAARLLAALGNEPKTSGEVAAILGIHQSSACGLLRRNADRGICHIAGAQPRKGAGRATPLWAAGKDVKETVKVAAGKKAAEAPAKPQTVVIVRRDPLQEALFGPAPHISASAVPGRVIAQSMEVTEDEVEVA
ncbi:hypothetical protein P3T40_003420 [Paraburkholderia sp. EB58]|uniref:hypothetical protein n=1 Tax=Paraburkholderia sp. EB58 TaxID=3035125 RepID=UPI003D1E519A